MLVPLMCVYVAPQTILSSGCMCSELDGSMYVPGISLMSIFNGVTVTVFSTFSTQNFMVAHHSSLLRCLMCLRRVIAACLHRERKASFNEVKVTGKHLPN